MPNQSLGLVIGDVSGHGFGPALLMASTQALLRSLAQTHTDVSPILEGANRFLVEETDVDRFVTLLYVRLDLPTRSIVYANAGHPTAYVLDREGAVKHRLESLSLPLAIDGGAEFPCRGPLPLEPGDVLLMTTDGVLEARSPDESFFGIERMLDVVVANRARPAREIIESLFGAVRLFSGTAKLTDDVTAVAVKVGD
jgi:sigma-B regulation protein RsbU (phosphoserine phosphatase)